MTSQSIALAKLRPTQMTVGLRLVKLKRQRLRGLEGQPQELVDFILANPIRVVAGPRGRYFVTDHHHFGLALLRQGFKTAPMFVVEDLSHVPGKKFWAEMEKRHYVHPEDARGKMHGIKDIPKDLADLADDPYRSLAGLVREHGGFRKTEAFYMEFQWGDYFRKLVAAKQVVRDFPAAVKKAMKLAAAPEARHLPGFVGR